MPDLIPEAEMLNRPISIQLYILIPQYAVGCWAKRYRLVHVQAYCIHVGPTFIMPKSVVSNQVSNQKKLIEKCSNGLIVNFMLKALTIGYYEKSACYRENW